MIIFLDSGGTIVSAHYGNIGNGSSVDWIYAVAPIASATAYINFELPNGDYTQQFLMTSYSAEVLGQTDGLPKEVLDLWTPNGPINFWAVKLDQTITKYSGTVKYTIRFTFASGDVLTSSEGSFTVGRSKASLPSSHTALSVYTQIQSLLESVISKNEVLNEQISANAAAISDLTKKNATNSTNLNTLTKQNFTNTTTISDISESLEKLESQVAHLEMEMCGTKQLESLIDRSVTEITSDVESVGEYSLYRCVNLTSATFPNATSIGERAFHECHALQSVNAPNVTSIGKYAFYKDENLTSVDFPNLTTVDRGAFHMCYGLKSASLPKLTALADSSTFDDCFSLESIDIPNLRTFGAYDFDQCTSLKSVNFPMAQSVRPYSFNDCTSLTDINLPEATGIEYNAFQNCSALKTVDFPKVTVISWNAFVSSGLTTLILRSDTVCTIHHAETFANTPLASRLGYIYVPSAQLSGYKAHAYWKTYANQLRALEDYTVDGTTTGALDESKI